MFIDIVDFFIYNGFMSYYTNGAYLIKGRKKLTLNGPYVRGRVIKTRYPSVYEKGRRVMMPIHNASGNIQFHKLEGTLLKMEMKRDYDNWTNI
jgi:hypothetical protein